MLGFVRKLATEVVTETTSKGLNKDIKMPEKKLKVSPRIDADQGNGEMLRALGSTGSGDTSFWDKLTGTVSDVAGKTIDKIGTSAGNSAVNWFDRQVQTQLLDPLERDTYKPENAPRQTMGQAGTTGQSPTTNKVERVLFDYKPESTGSGNTAVLYMVGGILAFIVLTTYLRPRG